MFFFKVLAIDERFENYKMECLIDLAKHVELMQTEKNERTNQQKKDKREGLADERI